MNELDRLRAWRAAKTGRCLVIIHTGEIRLIDFRDAEGRFESDFANAGEAIQRLEANTAHWVPRRFDVPPVTYNPTRRQKPTEPKPAPRVLSQTRRAVRQRAYRARQASAAAQ